MRRAGAVPYLSHPVRRIRDDPTAGEDVSLLLGFDEGDGDPPVEAVEAVVADVGGTVDRQLEFATVEVTVPEPAVARLCEFDGLARVETSGTLGLAVDTVAGPEEPDGDAGDDPESASSDTDDGPDDDSNDAVESGAPDG